MFDETLKHEVAQIAKDSDLEPFVLMAVVEVESAGKLGTKICGRAEPLIRFEGHYFYRLLPAAKRNIAVVNRLAHATAGRVKNPITQRGRWHLLGKAKQIDRPAALASVSWGAGQVMGDHWRWLGYASIDALVSEARSGAAGQVRLMMRYIEKAELLGKLKDQDWAGFARAYNGPSFRKYGYDTKIAAAFERRCRTSGRVDLVTTKRKRRNAISALQLGSTGAAVSQLQANLNSLGYTVSVDGDFGPASQRAVKLFQHEYQLEIDGVFGPKSMECMRRKLPPAG